MKKKLLSRAAAGALAGLAISYAITILLSLGWGGGSYLPCRPELAALAGSESRAVALQALFALLVGAGFGACSLIWQIDRWSLARQTGVYFFLISLVMLPAAYGMYWMEHSLAGFAPCSSSCSGGRACWPDAAASTSSTTPSPPPSAAAPKAERFCDTPKRPSPAGKGAFLCAFGIQSRAQGRSRRAGRP